MKPRRLLGVDGLVDRCPECGDAVKAGAWLKDGENGKPRILMVLSYCKKCEKHLRTTYMFYEQYSFSLSKMREARNEATVYDADPLQVSPERVAV